MPSKSEVPAAHPPLKSEGLEVLDGSSPWRNLDLPEKPGGFLYGVRFQNHPKFGNQDHPCGTEKELLETLQQYPGHIDIVYLPDEDTGVPRLSLNRYIPFQKKDLWKRFLRSIPMKGGLGTAAIIGAMFMKDQGNAMTLFVMGLLFGIIPVFDTFIQWLIYPKNKPLPELKRSMLHGSAFFSWIEKGKRSKILIWLMLAIIGIAYWGQMRNFDAFTNLGKVQGDAVRVGGEWWRILTGTLMHGPFFHIAMNGLGLFYIGKFIHRLTHPVMVLVVFVVSAITGALASTLFSPAAGSVGASGGVVGMIGFITWLVIVRHKELPYDFRSFAIRNIFLLAVLGTIGFLFVDNAGHAGGFLGGLACGLFYHFFHRDQWDIPTTPALSLLGVIAGAILLLGFSCCLDLFYFDSKFLIPHLPLVKW